VRAHPEPLAVALALFSVQGWAAPPGNPSWVVFGDRINAHIGRTVATAGDVNGDGFDDVLVGAPFYASDVGGGGRAYLYPGSAAGPSGTAVWTIESDQSNSQLGAALSSVGDVNGDGFDDVAVGAPRYDGATPDSGRVLVFHGSSAGLPVAPSTILEVPIIGAQFGGSVAGLGDVNGDGFDDLAASAPVSKRVFVFFGSAAGFPADFSVMLFSGSYDDGLAGPVSGAGDVNGDGLTDILVTNGWSATGPGKVHLYLGPLDQQMFEYPPDQTITGSHANDFFGASLAGAGDLDGDSFDDVVIGAYGYSNGPKALLNEGAAFVHSGSGSGLSATPSWRALGGASGAYFGTRVDQGGDINGDGHADLLVRAPSANPAATPFPRVSVFFGTGTGPALASWWSTESAADTPFLSALAGVGDFNGDGLTDILVGNDGLDGAYTDQGAVGTYPGFATPGPDVEAGFDQMPECTGPQGADATLSGTATPVPGGAIGALDWYESYGTPAEAFLGAGTVIVAPLALGSHVVTLRATDTGANEGFDDMLVTVRDTIPPTLTVGLSRNLLWPPNHRMVSVSATGQAADACGVMSVNRLSQSNSEPDDAPGLDDGSTTQDLVTTSSGFNLRAERDEQGGGRVYRTTYAAIDKGGNRTETASDVLVPHDIDGVTEPLILHVEQAAGGTVLRWSPVPGAINYNVIRGDVATLREFSPPIFIDLGPITCLAADLTATDTSATPDPAIPAIGTAFYYMAEYDDGIRVGYGTVSVPLPRSVLGANSFHNCP